MNAGNGGAHSAVREGFRKFALFVARMVGSPVTFVLAVAAVIAWAALGPLFGFSNTWQLVINTATTIVTFLMVFLIQNTQNRDSRAMHLKLDELIRAVKGARNKLVNLEEMTDAELDQLHEQFQKVCGARRDTRNGKAKTPACTHLDTQAPSAMTVNTGDAT